MLTDTSVAGSDTMRVAVMYDVDDIRLEHHAVPRLQPGDVLVKAAASGVCSGDLMPWYVRRKVPFVFGHEVAGTVVATGARAASLDRNGRSFAIGDRIFAHHHAPCLRCARCARGAFVHCASWRATAIDPGGMAEYFRVPRANLADAFVLPDGVSFADGSLIEPLGCVVKSLRRAFGLFGDNHDLTALDGRTVYVIGLGVMGLMHVAVATHAGGRVFGSDFIDARRELARSLGAEAIFLPADALAALRSATGAEGADAVICGPGSGEALQHAIDATVPDGSVVMFTPLETTERFMFDQSAAYFRDLRLIASYSCGPTDTRMACDLMTRGVVTADKLAAVSVGLESLPAAYEAMRTNAIVKAIVTFA